MHGNVFALSFFLQDSAVSSSYVLCFPLKRSPVPNSSREMTLKQCFPEELLAGMVEKLKNGVELESGDAGTLFPL